VPAEEVDPLLTDALAHFLRGSRAAA
jgi:hypothetical protein